MPKDEAVVPVLEITTSMHNAHFPKKGGKALTLMRRGVDSAHTPFSLLPKETSRNPVPLGLKTI